MNYLQEKLASLFPRRPTSEILVKNVEKLEDIIAQYGKAEEEEEKKELLDKIYSRLPQTLFLAAVCFPEDDPQKAVHDRTLHASPGSKGLYEANKEVVLNGNPFYRPNSKDTGKRMHLRTFVAKGSGTSFIPLFTDFTQYMPVFGGKSRVALFTIREVKAMCQRGQGILINPGENGLIIKPEDLRRIK